MIHLENVLFHLALKLWWHIHILSVTLLFHSFCTNNQVEQIIREDYYVEAMEVVEMYCDLLLARMGLLETMKHVDEGIAEAVSSIIWVAPRMQTDAAELKVVSVQDNWFFTGWKFCVNQYPCLTV